MKKPYHILDSSKQQPVSPDQLTRLLSQNGQLMLPLVELVEQCRGAVDEIIDVTGRAAIQAVLELSAQQVTGGELSQPGKKRASDVVRWGRQPGRVRLSNRKLRVSKPRLRKRSGGEVEVPAYAAMQDDERLGARMLDILMKGVSTRNYAGVIGAMAGTVGVSKSAVSQETIEAAEKSIDEVLTRRLDELDLLVIYVGWFDLLRPCRAGRGGRGPSGEQACARPAACRHREHRRRRRLADRHSRAGRIA